jgi:hypothetical protein
MHRVLNVSEHNLFADSPKPIAVPAATATEVLPNEQRKNTGEIAYRYIQNVGANPLYYTFGMSTDTGLPVADATANYHGMLPSNAQLDCSNHRLRVCVFSTAGTTVATTIIRRRDLVKANPTSYVR